MHDAWCPPTRHDKPLDKETEEPDGAWRQRQRECAPQEKTTR